MNNDMSSSIPLCTECGTILRTSFNFCPKCGKSITVDSSSDEIVPTNENIPKAPNPNRVGIRADVLMNIMDDLNDDQDMQDIFGYPVLKSIVVVADNNDLRIEDAGVVELPPANAEKFLQILDETLKINSI